MTNNIPELAAGAMVNAAFSSLNAEWHGLADVLRMHFPEVCECEQVDDMRGDALAALVALALYPLKEAFTGNEVDRVSRTARTLFADIAPPMVELIEFYEWRSQVGDLGHGNFHEVAIGFCGRFTRRDIEAFHDGEALTRAAIGSVSAWLVLNSEAAREAGFEVVRKNL